MKANLKSNILLFLLLVFNISLFAQNTIVETEINGIKFYGYINVNRGVIDVGDFQDNMTGIGHLPNMPFLLGVKFNKTQRMQLRIEEEIYQTLFLSGRFLGLNENNELIIVNFEEDAQQSDLMTFFTDSIAGFMMLCDRSIFSLTSERKVYFNPVEDLYTNLIGLNVKYNATVEDNLYVNNGFNVRGISELKILKVNNTSEFNGRVNFKNKIGINNTNPEYNLDVNGDTRIINTLLVGGNTEIEGTLRLFKPLTSRSSITSNSVETSSVNVSNIATFQYRVGIGTDEPQYPLDVKGAIRAAEIKIESIDNFPDYVFKKDYFLLSINEVNEHIQTYGRLPNIPSATEVKENGVSLVEMQVKLLEKVEELTLYIIELNKEIECLKDNQK